MAITIPWTLKASQLRTIAIKCGIASSCKSKSELTQRLIDEISSVPKTAPKTSRILSIDMGIRNLAYCILDVSSRKSSRPSIISWQRLAVSNAPTKSDEPELKNMKEAFDPATLSSAAYALLRHKLLTHNPDVILIERQRFRSMGARHVFEWTIRVNMLESMLYAVLHTLRAERLWNGNVNEVAPGKVGPFWIKDKVDEKEKGGELKKERKSKNAKIKNKGLKIDLVRNWLQNGDMVKSGSQEVDEMAKAYVAKWDKAPGRRKKGAMEVGKEEEEVDVEKEEMGKLDDLADSLLQGMAWIRWQENRRTAMKHGVEALLDS